MIVRLLCVTVDYLLSTLCESSTKPKCVYPNCSRFFCLFVFFFLKDGRKREIYKLFIVSKDSLKAQVIYRNSSPAVNERCFYRLLASHGHDNDFVSFVLAWVSCGIQQSRLYFSVVRCCTPPPLRLPLTNTKTKG